MRVRGLLTVGVCVVVLVGCSVDRTEPPGLTASTTASTTPSPTPTPTSSEVTTTDLSDPELGIMFVDTPDLTGPAASAHDAAAVFEVEYWRGKVTGVVSPALVQFVSPGLLSKVENGVQRNNEDGWRFAGTMRVTISDVAVDGASATVSVCSDYADVLFTKLDGSAQQTFEDLDLSRYERTTTRLSTFDGGTTWRPEDATFDGETC